MKRGLDTCLLTSLFCTLALPVPAAAHANLPLPSAVRFSWERVQPFFHADNVTGPYSDEAIRAIARFPLVTLEKWHELRGCYLAVASQRPEHSCIKTGCIPSRCERADPPSGVTDLCQGMYTVQHYTPRRSTKITQNKPLADFANYPRTTNRSQLRALRRAGNYGRSCCLTACC